VRRIVPLLAIALALSSTACQDIPLVADDNATIILTSDKTFLHTSGDTAQVTVQGFSGAQQTLRDGTIVALTATLGTIQPSNAELHDGRAIVTFKSGTSPGQSKITARSGNAVGELTIDIDYSAVATIVLSAESPSLPAGGGETVIRAEVTDGKGIPFVGVPVTFLTTKGTFTKGQNPILTGDQGIATNTLQTEATAEVTARSLGQSATIEVTVADNVPPTASISFWPPSPKVDESVTFDGRASSDPDGEVVQYFWSFSDGQQAKGRQITRSFPDSVTYEVFLQVKDNLGALSDIANKSVTVQDKLAPTASFTYFPPTPTVGAAVTFDGSTSSDPDGEVTRWRWDFGDGGTDGGEVATHSFRHTGLFQVRLTVTDDDGLEGQATQSITIGNNQAPIASFTFVRVPGTAELKYEFDASSSQDLDGYIATYTWEFDDESPPVTSSSVRVTHTFPEKATYQVRLVVTDNLGSMGEVVKDVIAQ